MKSDVGGNWRSDEGSDKTNSGLLCYKANGLQKVFGDIIGNRSSEGGKEIHGGTCGRVGDVGLVNQRRLHPNNRRLLTSKF